MSNGIARKDDQIIWAGYICSMALRLL